MSAGGVESTAFLILLKTSHPWSGAMSFASSQEQNRARRQLGALLSLSPSIQTIYDARYNDVCVTLRIFSVGTRNLVRAGFWTVLENGVPRAAPRSGGEQPIARVAADRRRGRPSGLPCATRRARPARTRLMIGARSNSTIAPRVCIWSLPAGVVALMPSAPRTYDVTQTRDHALGVRGRHGHNCHAACQQTTDW